MQDDPSDEGAPNVGVAPPHVPKAFGDWLLEPNGVAGVLPKAAGVDVFPNGLELAALPKAVAVGAGAPKTEVPVDGEFADPKAGKADGAPNGLEPNAFDAGDTPKGVGPLA